MARTKLLALPAVVPALLIAAAVAVAEPARDATLSSAATVFEWEDGPEQSTGTEVANVAPMCTDGFPCDDTLLKLAEGGVLEIIVDGEGVGRPDMDLYVYTSNEKGEAVKQVKASESTETDEKLSIANIKPGYYLVRAAYFSGFNMTYKGKATLKPAAPVAPTGASPVPTNNPPEAKFGKLARSYKASKLKAFKGTASDDSAVARVEVGVLQLKGSKCRQMTARGTFARASKCTEPTTFVVAKGTTTWTLKLKKRFPRGKYVAFVRAVDDAGTAQQGFGAASKKSFRVK